MDEYISREAVINITAETGAWETQKRVREFPAADVQLVKHGRWIDFPECLEYEGALDSESFVCSECHHVWNTIDNCAETFKCCPNCGSKNEGAEKFKYYPSCGSKDEGGDSE